MHTPPPWQGLSNAGRSLCDGTDAILDKDMPPAADYLDASAVKLHEAAVQLKGDPRSKSAKDMLMGMGSYNVLAGVFLPMHYEQAHSITPMRGFIHMCLCSS